MLNKVLIPLPVIFPLWAIPRYRNEELTKKWCGRRASLSLAIFKCIWWRP